MPAQHISTTIPAAAEAADRNGEVCALVGDTPRIDVRRWNFSGKLCYYVDGVLTDSLFHSEVLSSPSPAVVLYSDYQMLERELAAERNKSESLRAQLHGMQDGSLLRDTQAALSAERKRADAADADARRFGWVLPILSGDESGIADARAFKLALGISKGLTARAIIDEAVK